MSLIKCPECSKDVSDEAKICPSCGYKLKKFNKKYIVISILVLLYALGVYIIYKEVTKKNRYLVGNTYTCEYNIRGNYDTYSIFESYTFKNNDEVIYFKVINNENYYYSEVSGTYNLKNDKINIKLNNNTTESFNYDSSYDTFKSDKCKFYKK